MDTIEKLNSRAVDRAIDKGINYLLSQNVNGCWRGFPTLAGESDIWVTGFVLAHIHKLFQQPGITAASENFLLQSRHSSGGWSYSAIVPPDADSTAWCLTALQSTNGIGRLALEEALGFMWIHFTGKGISTYRNESGIREFISAPPDYPISGWISAHPDVSIAALLANFHSDKTLGIMAWLTDQQTKDGFINSYWWLSPYYTITLLLRVLSVNNKRLPDEWANRLAETMKNSQFEKGGFGNGSSNGIDAFTTALALESFTCLSYLGLKQETNLCAKALLNSQQEDGSWTGDFILRIPVPHIINPAEITTWNIGGGGGNCLVKDKEGLFATAMACHALDCWRQVELQSV
jgi:hypothetical protein